jgi:uridylate kinase
MRSLIISLGGSLIVPDKIDVNFLRKFKSLIIDYINKNKMSKVGIVCGGGSVCRDYIKAGDSFNIKEIDRDWIGIASTKLNAEFVRAIFKEQAYEKVIVKPTEKIKTDKRILIGSGWEPGCSSDLDAVLLANNLLSNTIINMTNIDYVYDKDPRKFTNAKPVREITWGDYLKIIGDKWRAGLNFPFDPIASKKAKSLGLRVIILNGRNLDNLKDYLEGKTFKGTIINSYISE